MRIRTLRRRRRKRAGPSDPGVGSPGTRACEVAGAGNGRVGINPVHFERCSGWAAWTYRMAGLALRTKTRMRWTGSAACLASSKTRS
jgi:hypothetical protein